jgi:drug/metabolite transporter, DME family
MTMVRSAAATARDSSGAVLVAMGAAMWGTDALFRRGLALDLPAAAVVFGEHAILVAMTLPLLVRRRDELKRLGAGDWLCLLLIGAGASAAATVMFTAAFTYGDPNTPLLLQKFQPAIAVLAAHLVLGERIVSRYLLYFAPAVVGTYLITFSNPTEVSVEAFVPAALALGAAALWALGTVLGRRVTGPLSPTTVTSARFAIGLPVAAGILATTDGAAGFRALEGSDIAALFLLALIPGLIALLVYYQGLRRTPASAATLAELAFPLAGVIVNYVAFDAVLTASQWIGLAVLSGAITALSLAARRGSEAVGVRIRRPAMQTS